MSEPTYDSPRGLASAVESRDAPRAVTSRDRTERGIALRGAPGDRLTFAFALVGLAICSLAVVIVVAGAPRDEAAARGLVELLVVGVPIGAGLYAIQVPHDARFGFLLIGTGLAWSLTALGESSHSVPYSVGRVAAWLVFPWVIYLMLAYPEGRLVGDLARRLYYALALVLAVLFVGSALFVDAYPEHTPWATCRADCPANAFLLLGSQPAFMDDVVQPLRELLAIGLFIGVTVSMARKWRFATPLRRRTVGPVMLMSVLSIVLLAAFFAARRAEVGAAADTLGLLWSVSIAGIAAAFFVGLVRRRLLIGEVVGALGLALRDRVDPGHVRDALASRLDDPRLRFLVRDGPSGWRDSGGTVEDSLPQAPEGRAMTVIRDGDAAAAALEHDADLLTDTQLRDAIGSVVLAVLRQQTLETRLDTSMGQLEESRRRIATAADVERARIERDLHDGAQQRLVTLRIRLTLAEEMARKDPAAAADRVAELGAELEETIDELRALAHGVYPSVLSDRGLEDALRSAALRTPIPVHLEAHGVTRHPPEIETAVYYTCLEALQNTSKHAREATAVWLTLREREVLEFEARDDGEGFALEELSDVAAHAGLRNMRDRLEAVGGHVTIDTAPGRGTRVSGSVPLR